MLIQKNAPAAAANPARTPNNQPSNPEPAPAPSADSYVSMLPQDPTISTIETVAIPKEKIGTQLSGPRLHTEDSIPVAQADEQGNYIYDLSTPQFDQVNTYAVVAGTLQTYEHYSGHMAPWSFHGPLVIHPHAGEGKTAYYSRWDESINFFQWDSPSAGKVVKTSQSFDVASHEIGHAILDGLRPALMGGGEGKAFHEGFGDSSAILHSLQYDSNLERILGENGGDFSKPSMVTRLAEEFGTAFNHEDDNPNNDDHPYYRTSLNEFKYQDPKTLPSDSYPPSQPEEVLTSEAHSFSRVWSGAFYRMLGSLYDQCAGEAPSQLDALKQARDALGTVWARSLDHLPAANLKFRQVASGMLREADKLENGRYFDALASVMVDRQLLTPEQVQDAHRAAPSLKLAGPVKTAEQAQAALASWDGAPAGDWKADKPLEGADGRQVLTFRSPQRVPLDLGFRGEAALDVDSGLTLVFDAQGQLLSQTCTPVSQEDIEDAQRQARSMIDSGKAQLLHSLDGPPLVQLIPTWD